MTRAPLFVHELRPSFPCVPRGSDLERQPRDTDSARNPGSLASLRQREDGKRKPTALSPLRAITGGRCPAQQTTDRHCPAQRMTGGHCPVQHGRRRRGDGSRHTSMILLSLPPSELGVALPSHSPCFLPGGPGPTARPLLRGVTSPLASRGIATLPIAPPRLCGLAVPHSPRRRPSLSRLQGKSLLGQRAARLRRTSSPRSW